MAAFSLHLLRLASHQRPDHLCRTAGLREVLPSELGIALSHLDIRVTENLRKLVEIAAVHHVPGRKRVTQIVEPEILNLCSFEQRCETPLQSLPPALVAPFGREEPILTDLRRVLRDRHSRLKASSPQARPYESGAQSSPVRAFCFQAAHKRGSRPQGNAAGCVTSLTKNKVTAEECC